VAPIRATAYTWPSLRACPNPYKFPIFGQGSAVEEEVRSLDIDSMSPIEAINKLYELKKKAEDKVG
jgi:DNA mismatch repair protein MutS